MNIEVNYLAVLLAGVASMVLGFLWYGNALFGKVWSKEHGYNHSPEKLKKMQQEMGKWYALTYVVSLLTAYVLAHVMVFSENFYHYDWVQTGLTSAFWMWLGFTMPVQLMSTIFSEKKNFKIFFIDTGYQLVSLIAMGAVLGMVR